ncbi:MAG: hypothetical protein LBT70_00350, partial [Holosporaceae bacterium]|nr:hypothetical protein [Holosporaceae bacterium]
MKKIMIIMSSLCIFHAYALEEKDIENANEGITYELRNSLNLLSVSVSKPLPFCPDFNPHNSLEHKVICKDQNGKDLYINNFKTKIINKVKDFWCTFYKTGTSEIHIIDSINLDYVFTLYNVQKTFLYSSSFAKLSNDALFELQILQQIICLKILQDCITKKQPTPFMKQNNLFKIFS